MLGTLRTAVTSRLIVVAICSCVSTAHGLSGSVVNRGDVWKGVPANGNAPPTNRTKTSLVISSGIGALFEDSTLAAEISGRRVVRLLFRAQIRDREGLGFERREREPLDPREHGNPIKTVQVTVGCSDLFR
jgi:hypothetical protein